MKYLVIVMKYQFEIKLNIYIHTILAPKVMPPILLCWLTVLEASTGGMAVEVEPPNQHFVTFCCLVTDGSRGVV